MLRIRGNPSARLTGQLPRINPSYPYGSIALMRTNRASQTTLALDSKALRISQPHLGSQAVLRLPPGPEKACHSAACAPSLERLGEHDQARVGSFRSRMFIDNP